MIRLLNTPKVEVRTYLSDKSETSLSPKGNICSLCQYPESDQLCYCNREDETLSPVMVIETLDSPSSSTLTVKDSEENSLSLTPDESGKSPKLSQTIRLEDEDEKFLLVDTDKRISIDELEIKPHLETESEIFFSNSNEEEFRNKEPSQNDEQEGSLKSELKYDFCAEGEEM